MCDFSCHQVYIRAIVWVEYKYGRSLYDFIVKYNIQQHVESSSYQHRRKGDQVGSRRGTSVNTSIRNIFMMMLTSFNLAWAYESNVRRDPMILMISTVFDRHHLDWGGNRSPTSRRSKQSRRHSSQYPRAPRWCLTAVRLSHSKVNISCELMF